MRAKDVVGKKLFSFYLPPSSHRQLKISAAMAGMSMSVLLEKLVEEHLARRTTFDPRPQATRPGKE